MAHITASLVFTFLSTAVAAGQTAGMTIWFTALEKNNAFYSVLKASDIEVDAGGKTAFHVDRVSPRLEAPLEVVILVDASPSQKKLLQSEKNVALYFLRNVLIKGKDKVAIVGFDTAMTLVRDLTGDLEDAAASLERISIGQPLNGSKKGSILEEINVAPVTGKKKSDHGLITPLWGSVRHIINVFGSQKPAGARRALIILTNGDGANEEKGFNATLEAALKHQLVICPVSIENNTSVLGLANQTWLLGMALNTGGVALFPQDDPEKIPFDINALGQRLRNYYEADISYDAANRGKVKKIRIEIVNPGVRKSKIRIVQPQTFPLPN